MIVALELKFRLHFEVAVVERDELLAVGQVADDEKFLSLIIVVEVGDLLHGLVCVELVRFIAGKFFQISLFRIALWSFDFFARFHPFI